MQDNANKTTQENASGKIYPAGKLEGSVYNILGYHYNVYFIHKLLLPRLIKTNITPNQITLFGFMCVLLSLFCIYTHHNVLAGIFIFIYFTADSCDGYIARYKNMTSKLGHYLDCVADYTFDYMFFLVVYMSYGTNIYLLIFSLFVQILYALLAVFYIVPNLKKLQKIHRFGLKKYFLERKILLGVDVHFFIISCILSCFFEAFNFFMLLIGVMFLFDLLYRLHELKINQIINKYENLKEDK